MLEVFGLTLVFTLYLALGFRLGHIIGECYERKRENRRRRER